MQDRFKFRCWDDYNREMLDLQEQDTNPYNICDFTQNNIMQCTGLKDKNGKLIYEGDIIQDSSRTDKPLYTVYWRNDSATFGIKMIKPSKFELYKDWHLNRSKYDYEVIGNIYENKELLDG